VERSEAGGPCWVRGFHQARPRRPRLCRCRSPSRQDARHFYAAASCNSSDLRPSSSSEVLSGRRELIRARAWSKAPKE
jgi:hypothetical protein